APDRACDGHREAGNAGSRRGPEVELRTLGNAEVVVDEDRQERKGEAETEDGHELGEPQRDQVPPPINTSRAQWRGYCRPRIGAQCSSSTMRSDEIGSRSTTACGLRLR